MHRSVQANTHHLCNAARIETPPYRGISSVVRFSTR
jgi:hypothetical protein